MLNATLDVHATEHNNDEPHLQTMSLSPTSILSDTNIEEEKTLSKEKNENKIELEDETRRSISVERGDKPVTDNTSNTHIKSNKESKSCCQIQ